MLDLPAHSWRLLLVDDDEDDFFITQTMLIEAVGRSVRLEWAGSYERGLEILRTDAFDAVLVDYDLGAHTGVDLIRAATQEAKANAETAPLMPFILYTGRGNFEVDVEAMQAGATLNITKQGATPQLLERSIHFAIERKQSERALQHSERRWRMLADAMPNLVWTGDESGYCDYLNQQWVEYTGRPIEEQLGRAWVEAMHPDDLAGVAPIWRRAVSEGADVDVNYRLRRHDGVYRWFKCRATPVRSDDGRIVQWYAVSTDIDDLMRYEAELRQRSADLEAARLQTETEKLRLEAVLEALPVGVAIVDDKGGSLSTNYAYNLIWSGSSAGPPPMPQGVDEYTEYKAWWVDSGQPLRPEEWASAQASLYGRSVLGQMLEIQRFDGSRAMVINSAAPIRNTAGAVVGSAVAIQDITQLRQAEKQVQESDLKYRTLFRAMSEAVVLFDVILDDAGKVVDFTFVDVNPAAEALLNLSGEACIGRRALEIFGTVPLGDDISQAVESGRTHLFEYITRQTGQKLSISITPIGERRAAAILVDVTESARAEASLRAREAELQLIMDITPALLSYIDRDFRYRRLNQNYVRWFNRSVEDMQGRYVWEVLGEAAWEHVRPYMERALRGEMVSYDENLPYVGGARWVHVNYIPHRDESGEVLGFVVLVVSLEEHKALENALHEALDRAVWLARFPAENPNPVARVAEDGMVLFCNPVAVESPGWGLEVDAPLPEHLLPVLHQALATGSAAHLDVEHSRRVYSVVAMPFPGDEYVNLYGQDVTERRQAEAALADYSARLQRSNRALENFAFIASHDMQEPLHKIVAFGDLLKLRYGEQIDATGQDFLARMQDAARRMQQMIDGLLAFARVDTRMDDFTSVDLAQTAREALSDLEMRLLASQGRVELGDLPVIEADAMQMRQLLLNLIGNALKFHRPGVPPDVRVIATGPVDEWVELQVDDNGVGLPENGSERLFQPFGRLHGRSQYEGSGMGLAICRKIVERHGGTIGVQSRQEAGATFIVRLPCKQTRG